MWLTKHFPSHLCSLNKTKQNKRQPFLKQILNDLNKRSCDTKRWGLTHLQNWFGGFNNFRAREERLFITSAARTSSKKWDNKHQLEHKQQKSIWCVVLRAVNNVGPAIRTVCSRGKQTAGVCPEMGAAAAHLPAARSVSSLRERRSFVATNGQVRRVRCRFQHPFNYHRVLDIWNRTKPTRVRL